MGGRVGEGAVVRVGETVREGVAVRPLTWQARRDKTSIDMNTNKVVLLFIHFLQEYFLDEDCALFRCP